MKSLYTSPKAEWVSFMPVNPYTTSPSDPNAPGVEGGTKDDDIFGGG